MKKKVIIIGGGIAGLSSAITFSKSNLDVTLIDKETHFLNQLKLYKAFYFPLKQLKLNFLELASKFHFKFIQKEVLFDQKVLSEWVKEKKLSYDNLKIDFDYLIISTGAGSINIISPSNPSSSNNLYTLEELKEVEPQTLIKNLMDKLSFGQKAVYFIGGGATGVQSALELADYFFLKKQHIKINLVDREPRLLGSQPERISEYVLNKFIDKKISYYPYTSFISKNGNDLILKNLETGKQMKRESDLTFLFPGVRPTPFSISANSYGQVYYGTPDVYSNVFAAGDCVSFSGKGLNSLSAQAAVRKGRLVARNIISHSKGRRMSEYSYKELGYFLSTGFYDAIGWTFMDFNIVSGPQAFVIKEGIELQMELFLKGVDTYIG
ncbi:MAG: FAD-dependent oxidoreductase [Leptospiraceae bacterium]|nr:FAD-dependent oxidoreductase [Leptospiraceae bacterium]